MDWRVRDYMSVSMDTLVVFVTGKYVRGLKSPFAVIRLNLLSAL